MSVWSIGIITLSTIIVLLAHQIYEYFKLTLSKPIERNIVHEAKSHYEQIYGALAASKTSVKENVSPYNNSNIENSSNISNINNSSISNNNIIPTNNISVSSTNTSNMADELMNFMSDLDNSTNEIRPIIIDNNILPYENGSDMLSMF
jgi:hypothetical protein